MKRSDFIYETVVVNRDEYKLLEKYRELIGKLKPGESEATRQWSFPVDDTDAIRVGLVISHRSTDPTSSSSEVRLEGARAQRK